MIAGQDLKTVAEQVINAKAHKRDYVADTRLLSMVETNGRAVMTFKLNGTDQEFEPTPICLGQIGDRVGIPKQYADRMRAEAPGLLAHNINHWFANKPEKRMLRTLRNGSDIARAFLSERYRPLDNADLAEAVLPKLEDMGLVVKSAAITETRLYIQAVAPKIEAEIKKVGDVVQSGIVISNSEIGLGCLSIRHLIYTLRCTNGMIAENVIKQAHVGRRQSGGNDVDEAREYFSDETRKADDKAFWMKVGDVMKYTLSREKFDAVVARLNATTEVEIEKPVEVVEVMQEKFGWTGDEQGSVLNHLIKGGDLTQYGLLNAVTRTAQDLESYDRAIEFEKNGGDIMLLPPTAFELN